MKPKCRRCGSEFHRPKKQRGSPKLYCSAKCRKRAEHSRMVKKHGPYMPREVRAAYSRKFHNAHREERNAERATRKMSVRNCQMLFKISRLHERLQEDSFVNNSVIELRRSMKGMDTDSIVAKFADMSLTVKNNLLWMAAALLEVESRGGKIEANRYLAGMLRDIGTGVLSVEAVLRFGGRAVTVSFLKRHPLEEQEELLSKYSDTTIVGMSKRKDCESPVPHSRATEQAQEARPATSILLMAKAGTTKDVADLVMQIILSSRHPDEVAELVLRELSKQRVTA